MTGGAKRRDLNEEGNAPEWNAGVAFRCGLGRLSLLDWSRANMNLRSDHVLIRSTKREEKKRIRKRYDE